MDPNHFKDDDSADITDVEALDIADYSLTPTKAAMDDAARAIHEALTALQQDYYIFGGYACIKLTASSRTTQDLDIVVPNHATRAWQDNDPFHKTKEGYVYLSHRDMCQIGLDIMVGGFQAFPSPDHAEIVEVDGIRFLGRKQQLMLHFQRFSLGKGPKIENTVADIKALRSSMIHRGERIDFKAEMLHTRNEGLEHAFEKWLDEHKDHDDWRKLDSTLRKA